MRPRTLDFVTAQADSLRAPLVMVNIWTALGLRIYSKRVLSSDEVWAVAALVLDGSWVLDGSQVLGTDVPIISVESRLLRCGTIRDSGSLTATLGRTGDRVRNMERVEIELDNTGDHFGRVLAQDTFLSAQLLVIVGYAGMRRDRFLKRFTGTVRQQGLTLDLLQLSAEAA